jgi:hypothetical protein
MTEKKFDIKNTKEAVVLTLKAGGAVKKSYEDGEFNASDLGNFFPVIPYVQPALEDMSLIPGELKDLDTQEGEELLSMVAADLGEIANAPKLISQINAALKAIKANIEFYKTLKSENA